MLRVAFLAFCVIISNFFYKATYKKPTVAKPKGQLLQKKPKITAQTNVF